MSSGCSSHQKINSCLFVDFHIKKINLSNQGFGGSVQYPKNYAKRATELIQQKGGLTIANEVRSQR